MADDRRPRRPDSASVEPVNKVVALICTLSLGLALANIEVVPLPAETPDIPHAHLPPTGQCRIWMPHEPPGQQSPPGSCETLAAEVPLGGWLIYRATPDSVGISAYSVDVADLVGDVRYYDAKTLEPLPAQPQEVPSTDLEVPRGHLPPLGECRVWFAGRAPGQQPSAGRCADVLARVPAGAWVLYRLAPTQLVVTAYHPEVPGIVLESRTFDVARGERSATRGGPS